MVKRFPRGRTTSKRPAAFVAVLAMLLTVLSLQTTTALGADEEKLKNRRSEVSQNLRDARGDLGHSSRQLVKAVRSLQRAEQKLASARKKLERTEAQLARAEKRDRQMQAKLEAAKERLERARAKLSEGRAEVAQQRDEVAEWAASNFQDDDDQMLGLRVFLGAESPESMTTQMDAVDSVNDKNADRFDRLRAIEVLLKVKEDEVEAAKEEVARQRAAAAENLKEKKALQAKAKAARDAVASRVRARAQAKKEAARAKAADRRRVAALESERSRIEARLQKIAARRAAERRRQLAAASRSGNRTSTGGFLSYPVNTYVTSSYGMRFHPILRYHKLHDGTDFGGGCGIPVRAAASGRVLSRYYNSGYGNRVIIDHGVRKGQSLSTSYNHLSAYSTYVGERVQQGDVIGFVGTTGYSTGCHLHFMVYENGGTVNPMKWL